MYKFLRTYTDIEEKFDETKMIQRWKNILCKTVLGVFQQESPSEL